MVDVDPDEMRERTLAHYRDSFATYGATAKGVDWNGPDSQQLNFDQVIKLLPTDTDIDLNDLGCGYGALADYLPQHRRMARYRGYDLNTEMIEAARDHFSGRPEVTFDVAESPLETADYGIASGIFTLRLERSDEQCHDYLVNALDGLDRTSRRGFAFNCLTSYSDPEKMQDYLYYPDPCVLFDVCKRRYARNVALLHDYGLYAFTILVRKA